MTKKVKRHSLPVIITHWLIAISSFLLLFTGFGQMPLYRRYMLTEVPGFAWADQYFITISMHYIGAILLIVAIFFHIVYHVMRNEYAAFPKKGDLKESIAIIKAMVGRGIEPPSDKFLAEQRVAYLYMGIVILGLVITGIIKTIQNLSAISMPYQLALVATTIHNIFTILLVFGLIAHLAAFAFKANRPLLESMFTGKVKEKYAKERHVKWNI
ncbi:MAG: cytochrome b/b6 domain-containing protein [Bacillota bacterium]|nr:cytochrome b/b6 domain-containing protein [Bacillota bacterium]